MEHAIRTLQNVAIVVPVLIGCIGFVAALSYVVERRFKPPTRPRITGDW